jgi:hypothetical protein
MKKIVIACIALMMFVIPATVEVKGQQPVQSRCNLSEANSPNIRGLRLSMTTEQLIALFPGSSRRKEAKDSLDRAKAAAGSEAVYVSFDPLTDATGNQMAGVDSVSVGLHKGRVVDYSVSYSSPTWRTIDEWTGKLSETFGLPRSQDWTAGPNENPNRILKCNGVEIEAALLGGGGSVRVRNTEFLKGGQEAGGGEERKRREFKP